MGPFNKESIMKTSMKKVFVALLLGLFPLCISAQEKNMSYYNTHEKEILPDARVAFRKGEYERVVELCRWHYFMVGDHMADSLRETAERCAKLSEEMNDLLAGGETDAARGKARDLLSMNPDDPAAAAILKQTDTPPVQDSLVTPPPVEEQVTPISMIPEEEQKAEIEEEEKTEPAEKPIEDIFIPEPVIANPEPVPSGQEFRTRFVAKAGVSILDMTQLSGTVAPGAAFGVYDLGGGRIGGELGGYLCSGLSTASMTGLDAALVFRAVKGIYPKAGLGFFSCKSLDQNDSFSYGMCAVASVTFLIGGHFCVEAGVKYYPVVSLSGLETVSTAGTTYDFPATVSVLSGGIAPVVSLGWAF